MSLKHVYRCRGKSCDKMVTMIRTNFFIDLTIFYHVGLCDVFTMNVTDVDPTLYQPVELRYLQT